jgi:hypothetical protein
MIVYVVVEDWHDLGEWSTEPVCVCKTLEEAKEAMEKIVKDEIGDEPGWDRIQDDDLELVMQYKHNGEVVESLNLLIYRVPMKECKE